MERCPGVLATRAAMRVQFLHQHVHNNVVILEEGNLPYHGAPDATSRSPGRCSTGATWGPASAGLGRSVKGGDWRRRICG